jgi:glycyl-tRNA synthetase beta chain
MNDMLVEIGIEELPHAVCASTSEEFCAFFTNRLKEERIGHGATCCYATPRRLALLVREVVERQEDYRVEKRGPSREKAYVNGRPSKALLGFLKGSGIEEKDIEIRDSGNGMYVYAVQQVKGRRTEEVLPQVLGETLMSLRFPKSMRWEDSGFTFARPIRWVVYLFGSRVVPFEIAGVRSSRHSYGHRAYSGRIEIATPESYQESLSDASVIVERARRREEIEQQVLTMAGEASLQVPVEGEGLYDVNTDLTEFPHAVACAFDEDFLDLPPEVLMSEMIEHQHYFPLRDMKNGKLSNRFIAISNILENSESKPGYERVLRARLNDGRFFFNEDRKLNLRDYRQRLDSVTFHEKLGSMGEKVERISRISSLLCVYLGMNGQQAGRVDQVARLCKNDLVTLMVGEFPHLQGVMGYYYAVASGYPEEIALGIKEHYHPHAAGDALPTGVEGAVVGIADRIDTIMGIFSIGLKPKGSKDPFALRRKVLAIIRIVIGLRLHFSIKNLIGGAMKLYHSQDPSALTSELERFFQSRVRSIFGEMGFSYDEIEASLAGALDDAYEAYRRVQALHELRGNDEFKALLISFKRMSNIIGDEDRTYSFTESLLREEEEKALYDHYVSQRDGVVIGIREKNYPEVYRILSTFKPHVDRFFDHVLVMDENRELRENRLALLQSIIAVFSDIIDFSKIVQPGE